MNVKRISLLLLALCLLLPLSACGRSGSGSAPAGEALAFSTMDLDSNEVKSDALFKGAKVTVVNLWATWCGPCVRELPELEKLREDYADKGVQVVGILLETSASAIGDAKSILENAGADYPVLLPASEMGSLIDVQYIPTTYFVDSQGRVLGDAIVGADVQGYRNRLDKLLK